MTEVYRYLSDFKYSKQNEKVLRVLQFWINLLIKIKSKILMMFLTYDFMSIYILECYTSFTSLSIFAKNFSDESWMISRETCSNFISLFANTKADFAFLDTTLYFLIYNATRHFLKEIIDLCRKIISLRNSSM